MSNQKLADGGPGSVGDLVRNGGDVAGTMTNDDLKGYGPGFWPDMARLGGDVIEGDALSISGTPVLTATENSAYDGFTVTATGGTSPYTYALVGTWPAGITVNASSGAVSGTPTEDGSFASLSVKATDDDSNEAQLDTFTLVVAPDAG